MAVDADPRSARGQIFRDEAGTGHKIARRVLGVDATLYCVTEKANVRLPQAQGFATRNPYLLLDQIDTGDHLGNGMLDLIRVFISMK